MLAKHLRPRRQKIFGEGRCIGLDRNAKCRIRILAHALRRATEAGRHYGRLTAKHIDVLDALLWAFHNAGSGKCYPAYERIAERAGTARSTVYEAIHALEAVGILTWVNRLVRVREVTRDLFGHVTTKWQVLRSSNWYMFRDPGAKSELPTGTPKSTSTNIPAAPSERLQAALDLLGGHVRASFETQNGIRGERGRGPCPIPASA